MATSEMEIRNQDLLALCRNRNPQRSERDWCWRIAGALRLRRMEKGSVPSFAGSTGLSEKAITRMERGAEYASAGSLDDLVSFAHALGYADLQELIEEADTFISEDIRELENNARAFVKHGRRHLKNNSSH